MPQAILFDLDGTLVNDSMDVFLPAYFRALTKKLAHLVPPEKLIAQLNASTRVMVANRDPNRTLADAFAIDFFPKLGIPRETLMPLFDDFYANDYPQLCTLVQPIAQARLVVAEAIRQRYHVVIATMPVFPRIAIWQRLQWGNLTDFPYALITDYETMHASKPHAAYYWEIAARINCVPADCVMVGNEIENDIAPAKRAGMKTFWVTRDTHTDAPADWRGTLEDFASLLESGKL